MADRRSLIFPLSAIMGFLYADIKAMPDKMELLEGLRSWV